MGPNIVSSDTPALIVVYFEFILLIFTRCLRWHNTLSFGDVWQLYGCPLSNALLMSTSSK